VTKPKKTNPRRRPATQADVDRAFADGISAGVNTAMAILFIVLLDKTEADADFIAALMPMVADYSGEVKDKHLTYADLKDVLKHEYDITMDDCWR
jgi:hypothetical protein